MIDVPSTSRRYRTRHHMKRDVGGVPFTEGGKHFDSPAFRKLRGLSTSRVLPIPIGPTTRTTDPRPATDRSSIAASAANSHPRPTNVDSDGPISWCGVTILSNRPGESVAERYRCSP